ncbi:peptidase S8/S53 domain-containing protein, partial [Syncephalis fuscata]
GKDIKVGIIDSGIDYTHPALGGCFGAGCKVAYGWDFVGDAYTGADYPAPGWKPVPDSDPLDTCNGHGTHVAGLVAASSDLVTGNAPAATLGAYRVLSCTGSVAMDIIVSAMERAASDGMDVVNISIGTGKFYTDYADADAAQRLTARGIVVVASAGNDG